MELINITVIHGRNNLKSFQIGENNNLSSTFPAVHYIVNEEHYLTISSKSGKKFFIYYQNGTKYDHFFISEKATEDSLDFLVEKVIVDFFHNKIDEKAELLEITEIPDKEEKEFSLPKKKFDLLTRIILANPYWLIAMVGIVGIIVMSIAFDFDLVIFGSVLPILVIIPLVIVAPNILLALRYYSNDKDQSLKFNPVQKTVSIKKSGKLHEFYKKDLTSCEVVTGSKLLIRNFRDQSYLRLNFDGVVFIVTDLTINPLELISILNVNYRKEIVPIPRLKYDKYSEKEKLKIDSQKSKFLKEYQSWDTEKLEEMILNEYDYNEYAIDAAKEVLKSRSAKE